MSRKYFCAQICQFEYYLYLLKIVMNDNVMKIFINGIECFLADLNIFENH